MPSGIKFKTEAERKEGRRLARARYALTEKGKQRQARYRKSKKGKQKDVRYAKSKKGKQTQVKYKKSGKGTQTRTKLNRLEYLRKKDSPEFKKQKKESLKAWIKKNKDRHKATKRARQKKRLSTDPSFKIKLYLRSRMGIALKRQKTKKYYHFDEVIGCSPKELKEYLERKFRRGMTWENYSIKTWHIDHIIPCAKFDLTKEEEQRKCFHFSNLQPLWAKHNLQKGGR